MKLSVSLPSQFLHVGTPLVEGQLSNLDLINLICVADPELSGMCYQVMPSVVSGSVHLRVVKLVRRSCKADRLCVNYACVTRKLVINQCG